MEETENEAKALKPILRAWILSTSHGRPLENLVIHCVTWSLFPKPHYGGHDRIDEDWNLVKRYCNNGIGDPPEQMVGRFGLK